MCAIDDADPARIWSQLTPKARKEHWCGECKRKIHIGERYVKIKWLDYCGEYWGLETRCMHCTNASAWMTTVCGGHIYGDLYEELEEHWHEGYASIGMGRLMAGIKMKWKDGTMEIPDRDAVVAIATASLHKQVA